MSAIKLPLYEKHVALGAKMVEFAGFWMPVQYSSIIEEHLAVRKTAGIFDLSHMGEFIVSGKGAAKAVNQIITNNVEKLPVGKALYTPMCTPTAGIVDDILVYRNAADEFMLVVNAANVAKDYKWVADHLPKGPSLENVSAPTVLIAVQGPQSEAIVSEALADDLSDLEYYHHREGEIEAAPVRVSRTGYTGEDGFEVYVDRQFAAAVWDVLYELTTNAGGVPVGLGARDTLRLEMKFCLYGNDIDETTTPYEAGIGWTVKLDKGDFIGRAALEKQKKEGVNRRLVGFLMIDKAVPRHGFDVLDIKGNRIGRVTSGSYSPSLRENIGLAYVSVPHDVVGTEILVVVRDKPRLARIVETPFLKLLGDSG